MKFRISAGLKNIIGKDLITDDFVAIFELVKNSFDAYADRVDLYFSNDSIYVIDNGKGMSKNDITNKWLFVAYSAKLDDTEDRNLRDDYRSTVRAKRSSFAGNKGVGRFSCDRLGNELIIQSLANNEKDISQVNINWQDFETDQNDEFNDIDVDYKIVDSFSLPKKFTDIHLESGTILKISNLHDPSSWNRKKLLNLKSSIAKLIDPFGVKKDFNVYIHSPSELAEDKKQFRENAPLLSNDSSIDLDSPYVEQVNGQVKNLVFKKLGDKATKIKTYLSENTSQIYTELIDRGEVVYKIKEPNIYDELFDSKVSIELYYMNRIAKANFTRSMGVPVVNFGSVFVFNNGFRVYPIGEPRDDTLGLDTRKAQGHSRYLGTREVLGIIDIESTLGKFKETSSRDTGLVKTDAYKQLVTFFFDKAIKRLEAYVVNVSWVDTLDSEQEDLSRILTDQGKSRVVKVVSKLVAGKNVELLEYSEDLIDIISERNDNFETTLGYLQKFATKSDSKELEEKIQGAIHRFDQLKQAEEESRKEAERERGFREKAEEETRKEKEAHERTEKELSTAETALKDEKKRNLFLKKITSKDMESVLEFHHQIGIYSSRIKHLIELNLDNVKYVEKIKIEDYKHLLETISFTNQQILTISRIATVADYRLSAEEIDEDIVSTGKQYLETIARQYHSDILVEWEANDSEWVMSFSPLGLMAVIDNLVHNSAKSNSGSRSIKFNSYHPEKNKLEITVIDDGNGFAKHLQNDPTNIFDMGVTTTDGSGLGLYHVKQVINEMGGSIEADMSYKGGARFIIRFAR